MPEKKSSYRGFTAAQAKANKKYLEKFADIKIRMTPEERETIKAHAQTTGESVNAFINRAITETMERDRAGGEV